MPRSPAWEGEGGVDPAATLLQKYDRATEAWDLPRTGDYWDAISAAWRLGRHGEGVTIAVIDDGFDTSYSELDRHEKPWGVASRGRSVHGTAVALLILSVAPRAKLLLYPVASDDGWQPDLIESALRHTISTDSSIVNLSLGLAHPADKVYDTEKWMATIDPWPDLREDDLAFMVAENEMRLNGWRDLVNIRPSQVGRAAIAVTDSGRTVIAAAGNAEGFIYEPALLPSIYSAGFNRGRNPDPEDIFDRVRYVPPGFSQSSFSDFGVIEPPGVVGTSFAAPLISGMAALMIDRTDLSRYRDILWLSEMGSELTAEFIHRNPNIWEVGIDRWLRVIDQVFLRAVELLPEHAHSGDPAITCPECCYFALGMLGNYGLWKVNIGLLDTAEDLLMRALEIAPLNPHVLLILGRLWAIRAERSPRPRDSSQLVPLLMESAKYLRKGLSIQQFSRDLALLEEVDRGLRHPERWRLPLTYQGF